MQVSKRGQVTIPKHIRVAAGVLPGSEVSFSLEGSVIIITPVATAVRDDRRAQFRDAAARVRSSWSGEFKQLGANDIMDFLRGDAEAGNAKRRGGRWSRGLHCAARSLGLPARWPPQLLERIGAEVAQSGSPCPTSSSARTPAIPRVTPATSLVWRYWSLASEALALTRVAQARRHAVDRQMDASLHPLVLAVPFTPVAMPPQQFHLQVIERIEVRQAVLDRARQ